MGCGCAVMFKFDFFESFFVSYIIALSSFQKVVKANVSILLPSRHYRRRSISNLILIIRIEVLRFFPLFDSSVSYYLRFLTVSVQLYSISLIKQGFCNEIMGMRILENY